MGMAYAPAPWGGYPMALKSVIFGSTSMVALMLAGAAQAQTVPDSAAAPQADDEVNEIVVTGVRASIVGALNVRRESTQIVDSIVSEDVGKLPDNNVVEALQRVTGIQVTDRAGGETATITIRGLTDPLTTLHRAPGYFGEPCQPCRRLQDPFGRPAGNRPGRPDRRADPSPARL